MYILEYFVEQCISSVVGTEFTDGNRYEVREQTDESILIPPRKTATYRLSKLSFKQIHDGSKAQQGRTMSKTSRGRVRERRSVRNVQVWRDGGDAINE